MGGLKIGEHYISTDDEKARIETLTSEEIIRELQIPITGYALIQADLSEIQKQEWDKKVLLLKQDTTLKFFICGHTCDTGNDNINERIGLQRAENLKAYLISNGIAEDRILKIESKRDTELLIPNTSEENRSINRRVEIIIQR